MAILHRAESKFRVYGGGALIVAGSAAFLFYLSSLAAQFQGLMEASGEQTLGILPDLGLAFLHATQALAFGQSGTLFVGSRLLILFSSLVAIAVGAGLRRRVQRTRQARSVGLPCIY
jgi:hypothetical protein